MGTLHHSAFLVTAHIATLQCNVCLCIFVYITEHPVQYSTVLRVQDSTVMGQLGAWVLSHFCGAVQPKPHQ